MPSNNKLSVVLPISLNSQKITSDLDRLIFLLLPSFEKFWREVNLLEFLIIVPSAELVLIKNRLLNHEKFKIKIMSEDELCPTLIGQRGWVKQQILKIYAAKLVTTECYLTLDADIILRKTASIEDFFPNEKAIVYLDKAAKHWDWWVDSGEILKSSTNFTKETLMMGVTPEILYTKICIELINEIAIRNNIEDSAQFLFNTRSLSKRWTEYSLYWLYLIERGITEELYYFGENIIYEGLWIDKQLGTSKYKMIVNKLTEPQISYFLVIQSTIMLEPRSLSAVINSSSVTQSKIKFYCYNSLLFFKHFLLRAKNKIKKVLNPNQ